VECKLRWVNFRRGSDHRTAFLLAIRVTGRTDDKHGSTSDNPGSAGDKPGSAGNKPGSAGDKPGSAGNKPGSAGNKPGSAGDISGSTLNHSKAAREKQYLLWECCWCTWKSWLLLIVQRFLKLMYSVRIIIYISMYLYNYPSTDGTSGRAAGGTWEQCKVCLNITIE